MSSDSVSSRCTDTSYSSTYAAYTKSELFILWLMAKELEWEEAEQPLRAARKRGRQVLHEPVRELLDYVHSLGLLPELHDFNVLSR